VLNGRKCYITNGARAVVERRVRDGRSGLGRAGHRAFVVEKGTPGFEVGKIEDKMGLRANETAELVLRGLPRPGGEPARGRGGVPLEGGLHDGDEDLRQHAAARRRDGGRHRARGLRARARDFVKERYVLSRPIPRYAAIAERLAKVRSDGSRRRGPRVERDVHGRRRHAEREGGEHGEGRAAGRPRSACIEAIEICGAHGTLSTEHALLEKWFRDIKVYDIFEGTGNIQRIVIAKRLFETIKSF
jgi:acyl-CoA dehydrogenase